MSAAVLEALADRFGPSDADREEWLAARRQGITATEVRDLWLLDPGRRVLAMRELAEKKLGRRADSFSGNKYTAWGKEREPVIADLVRSRFGIEPESRLVRAAENPRHLASPDGIGEGFGGDLAIAEIKTSGHDLDPDAETGGTAWNAFEKAGYLAQMVWQMYVVGCGMCLFAWEERIGAGTAEDPFRAGQVRWVWVFASEHQSVLADLIAIADEFLALLDEMGAEAFEESLIDEELDTLAVNVLRGRELEAEAKALKEPAWKRLQMLLDERGEPFQQESVLARITYTPGEVTTPEVFDEVAAAYADPDLWDEVLQASQESERIAGVMARWAEHKAKFTKSGEPEKGKSRLTVTAVKKPKAS